MLSTSSSSNRPPTSVVVIGVGGLGIPVVWELISNSYTGGSNESAANCSTPLKQNPILQQTVTANHGSNPAPFHLRIIENDLVEQTNLNRQVFYTDSDLGTLKTAALQKSVQRLFPELPSSISLSYFAEQLSIENIHDHLSNADLVVECTDSVATKLLVNDYCISHGIPFLYAGVTGEQGVVLRVIPNKAKPSACLRCVFGDFNSDDLKNLSATCRRAGIFGAIAGHVGFIQANSALEYLNKPALIGSEPSKLYHFSFKKMRTAADFVQPSHHCPLGCAENKAAILDLRGERCPKTYLFTKLALEKIQAGSILDARYDSLESVNNIHESVYEEGYTTLSEPRQLYHGVWQLLIRKPEIRQANG